MTIIGVAMYGSGAREDGDAPADLDLLAVTTESAAATVAPQGLTISSYPLGELVCRASLGDLFVLHIVTEARVLYEVWPVFDRIRSAFRYRNSYEREIRLATDVGWFLVRNHDRFRDMKPLNARMAWCTRTILIARAASQRRPLFSARSLAEFASSSDVLAIVENKDNRDAAPDIVSRFRAFLRQFGSPGPAATSSMDELMARFRADRNVLGQRMAHLMASRPAR